MGSVLALWRYPLKSARGERLAEAVIDVDGLPGDRAWACVDADDETVGSAKHPRRWGRLLDTEAHLIDERGSMAVRVAGATVRAGTPQADTALGAYLGRPVRLTRVVPAQPRLHRLLPDDPGMVPQWLADGLPGQEMITTVAGAAAGRRFLDFGPVHLVTTGGLDLLGRQLGGAAQVPAARFRPNLLLDLPADPRPGREIRVGEVWLRVSVPTPRCVVPGLGQGDLPADRRLLAVLARHHRVPVPGLGRAACFGAYADVVRPGRVRVGDLVQAGHDG